VAKALIAGYELSAGNEYLFAGLDRAVEELQGRPDTTRSSCARMTDRRCGQAEKTAIGTSQ
jgi:hypothetical protein